MGMLIKHDRSQVTPKNVILIGGLGFWLVYLVFGGEKGKPPIGNQVVVASATRSDITPNDGKSLSDFVSRHTRREAWDRLAFHPETAEKRDPFARLDDTISPIDNDLVPDASLQMADSNTEAEVEKLALAETERRELEAELQRRKAHQLAQQLASIEGQQIDAVYQADGKTTALIGNRTITEGDLLADGIRVLRITPKGMTVAIESVIETESDSQPNRLRSTPPDRPRSPGRERR